MNDLTVIQKEVDKQFANKESVTALVSNTFKGLKVETAKQAALEGMMRGFSFKNFLEKDVYAIPYGSGYSLVTSIDYARKIGAKSGIVGKDKPVYETEEGDMSCTVTVHKRVDGYVGDFTATVYFSEYTTDKTLWKTKPRTMIAKVAEMHALRMACPEELAQAYVEEEMQKQEKATAIVDTTHYKSKLEEVKTLDELKNVWASIPAEAKVKLEGRKNELKAQFANENNKI